MMKNNAFVQIYIDYTLLFFFFFSVEMKESQMSHCHE